MLVITNQEIQQHVGAAVVIDAVEKAFAALGRGESKVFPVARGSGSDPRHITAIKSGFDASTGFMGVKAASYNPGNRTRGRASHTSTTLLIDDLTAEVVAVVEAGYLNGLRTAAADAIAVKYLARADSHRLGIIGLGAQAVFEIEAVAAVRPIDTVYAARRAGADTDRFAQAVSERTGLTVEFRDVEDLARQADIIVTATPATSPVLRDEWIRPGTHVSAMGSDNVGKMELPVELVARSLFYMDYPDQSAVIGEAQHLLAAGKATLADLRHRSLGGLICATVSGRSSADDITVFDSSGIAIQDIAAAHAAMTIVRSARSA
ncbi:ornithine cyclodeaminase family protein [Novosphingobium pokkalii]|uniref:Ornithine cyclodeaminase family protein n=1 Tax=Novosphingobium pokkalii TaxID=1770194 RepID=A0ABV7V8Q8_9SPHN|nr:ornithine cyclodeaminase family protein [Novosphingobium pokkalii]GHD03652.1 ornithine cyclodeaminase [Novosphingobium pokkalii]